MAWLYRNVKSSHLSQLHLKNAHFANLASRFLNRKRSRRNLSTSCSQILCTSLRKPQPQRQFRQVASMTQFSSYSTQVESLTSLFKALIRICASTERHFTHQACGEGVCELSSRPTLHVSLDQRRVGSWLSERSAGSCYRDGQEIGSRAILGSSAHTLRLTSQREEHLRAIIRSFRQI